eukprot:CAMPEP_0172756144 /NCGR_PEP_ID=MMETSP1074-20121228/161232_1 /TAXON_ID=2916 /ORGANISM="Ceratium fusus, Strain PA161109" /LENGTH=59 /DNA_ID=CAMNT_0013589355 /DNA_START=70 /DNA_END=249 /DNA_ORIENTATION=-
MKGSFAVATSCLSAPASSAGNCTGLACAARTVPAAADQPVGALASALRRTPKSNMPSVQ